MVLTTLFVVLLQADVAKVEKNLKSTASNTALTIGFARNTVLSVADQVRHAIGFSPRDLSCRDLMTTPAYLVSNRSLVPSRMGASSTSSASVAAM